jgi:hypothetical protein
MSSLMVVPDAVGQAAGRLETIGSALNAAHATAAGPTTGVLAPAADEVSAAITALMNSSAQEFQALSARAAMFHSQFVGLLNAGAGAYASTEAAAAFGLPPITIPGLEEELNANRPHPKMDLSFVVNGSDGFVTERHTVELPEDF